MLVVLVLLVVRAIYGGPRRGVSVSVSIIKALSFGYAFRKDSLTDMS